MPLGYPYPLLLALLLAFVGEARAQPARLLRVAIQPKVTLEDLAAEPPAPAVARDAASLSAALTQALQAAGARVVDLQQAELAQQLFSSEGMGGGKQLRGANVTHVDGLLSTHLACSSGSRLSRAPDDPNLHGLRSVGCAIHAKLVRADSGAVVLDMRVEADRRGRPLRSMHRHPGRALERLVRNKLRPILSSLSEQGLMALGESFDQWSLDLFVNGLWTRDQIRSFQQRLTHLPGVADLRKVVQRGDAVQFLLSGRGAEHLASLGDKMERDPGLAVAITFETPTTMAGLHALSRAFPRPVVSLGVFDPTLSAHQAEVMAESQLARLSYLEPLERQLVRRRSPGRALARAQQRAQALGAAWLLRFSVSRNDRSWLASCALEAQTTRKRYAAATATASSADQALRDAFSSFDTKYQSAWRDPYLREILWPGSVKRHTPLVIDDFRLLPGDTERVRLSVRNTAELDASAIEARVLVGDRLVGLWTQPSLEPGERIEQDVAVSGLPRPEQADVAVRVSYQMEGLRQSAVATGQADTYLVPRLGLSRVAAAPSGYQDLIDKAAQLWEEGDWRGALRALETAQTRHATGRVARLLGWIELAEGEVYAQTRRHLEESLVLEQGPLSPKERRHVQQLLEAVTETEAQRAQLARAR